MSRKDVDAGKFSQAVAGIVSQIPTRSSPSTELLWEMLGRLVKHTSRPWGSFQKQFTCAAANEGKAHFGCEQHWPLGPEQGSLWAFCVWLTVWWVALLHYSSPQVRQGSHAKLTAVEWTSWKYQNRLFLSWGVFWGDFATVKERAT